MKTEEHDEHMRKKMHELMEHYDRKRVGSKIESFKVKSVRELEKEIKF